MNRRMKAIAIGAITAAAGIGVGTLGAGVALAHANAVTGVASCQSNGTYSITWTITNDFNLTETVTKNGSSTGGGTYTPAFPFNITNNGSKNTVQSGVAGNLTSVTLSVHGHWTDNATHDASKTISLNGTCNQVTPVTPAYVENKTCGGLDTLTAAPNGNHITYSPANPTAVQLNPGANNNVITATADAGWSLSTGNPTKFSHTGSKIEVCPNEVTFGDPTCINASYTVNIPAAPAGMTYTQTGVAGSGALVKVDATITNSNLYKFQTGATTHWEHQFPVGPTGCVAPVAPVLHTSTDCGVKDSFTTGEPGDHVTYVPESGSLIEGQVVDITATPDAGYAFNGAQSVVYQLVGTFVEVCDTSVTPVAPNVTTSTDCGVADSFTAGPTTGVIYTPSSGTLGDGATVNVVATPDAGYKFDGPQSVTFTLTGGTIEACETTTTVGGVSEEPPSSVVQVDPPVVTAPPAPEAPIAGLPETGSSNTSTMLFGGLALIAGAAMLAAVRRRNTAK